MDDREDRIRERAYQIWETEGRPSGRAEDHWRAATGEIADEPQRRAPESTDRRMSEAEGDPTAGRAGSPDPQT